MSTAEHAKSTAARYALSMLKRPKFAGGGPVTGPLMGWDGGRTDTLPVSVPAGSYVIPADVVSGLPGAQGSSLAGHNALNKLFASLPLSPDEAPYGATSPRLARGHTIAGLFNPKRLEEKSLASGGKTPDEDHEAVPILAAGGEHVVPPDIVKRIGIGNLKRGHEILDDFVVEVRKRNIKDLKNLPKPAKD